MSNAINVKKVSQTLNLIALLTFFLIYTTDAFAQRRPNPSQQNLVLKAQLYSQIVHGPTILNVKNLVQQQNRGVRLNGQMLKAVIVKASKLNYYGRGAVQLIINGIAQGPKVQLSQFQDKIVLPVYGQGLIGSRIRQVQLKVNGTIQVKMVGLKLQTRTVYPMPAPRNPRTGRGRIPRVPRY